VLLVLILVIFGARLLQLQGVEASTYAARAEGQRLTSVTLPASRGSITDVRGTVLATTVEARNITADQTLVINAGATAANLAPVLNLPVATLTERLTGDRRFAYIAKEVTPETWAQVKALNLAGIFSEPTTKRVYPAADIGANVVGFVGGDGAGLGGIELAYQDLLAGKDGKRQFEQGAGGREIPTATDNETAPVAGSDVRLTIDRDIQWAAQQAIAAQVAATGAESGEVVVMDPRTGDIVAMATAPSFDAANPGQSPAADRGNRAVSEIYEPGSTSKVMTAAAVIEEGALQPESPVTVPGELKRGGKVFHDHNDHGTLNLTFAGVLAKSSNLGTILASEKIGPDKLYSYLKKFGIGDPTGLGFPGESRGLLPARSQWSQTTFPTVAFGQGLSVNAVQATDVFATIANDGLRVEPRLVAATVAPDGTVTPAKAPETHRVVSPATAQKVRAMLESVVSDEGTAPQAAIPGYRVAGKTGTANRVDPACGCYRGYTASFIGFAPADAPAFVVSVTLQDPKNGHFGGMLAGPVFKQVMSFALTSRHVAPTGTQITPLRLTTN